MNYGGERNKLNNLIKQIKHGLTIKTKYLTKQNQTLALNEQNINKNNI